jgi:hypothetical protein
MGHAPGLGRTARATAAGARDACGHTQRAGGAFRAGGAAEGGVRRATTIAYPLSFQ